MDYFLVIPALGLISFVIGFYFLFFKKREFKFGYITMPGSGGIERSYNHDIKIKFFSWGSQTEGIAASLGFYGIFLATSEFRKIPMKDFFDEIEIEKNDNGSYIYTVKKKDISLQSKEFLIFLEKFHQLMLGQ